jgi:nitrate reductase gamma subunit
VFLSVFICLTVLAFIIITINRAVKYAKMPMHTRWELYPVPQEKGRGEYGGSYYEEVLWWEKPRETSLAGELAEMFKEMLFIKKLFDNQRSLWWLSYSLHLGIYLLIAWAVLIFLGGFTEKAGVTVAAGSGVWPSLLYYLTLPTGILGGILVALGSISLFLRRVFTPTLRIYSNPQDYFNLIFIFVVAASGLLLWSADPDFSGARNLAASLLSLQPIGVDGLMTFHLVLLGCLLIYIPSSKMSHYVGKYFTYHKVLWENEPNLPGSAIMKAVEEARGKKGVQSWSAPHFQGAQNTQEKAAGQ